MIVRRYRLYFASLMLHRNNRISVRKKLKEKKYVEFIKDVEFPDKVRFIKNVKYRIIDETENDYIISKRKNISINKSREGELYTTGKI